MDEGSRMTPRPANALELHIPEPHTRPGDTVWVRGGTYRGTFTSTVTGQAGAPVVIRAYPGERAIIDGSTSTTSSTFVVRGSNSVIWGLEVVNSNTTRNFSTADSHSRPNGVVNYASNTKYVNLIVHDVGVAFYTEPQYTNVEVTGSIFYNNGWQSPSRGHGHALYIKSYAGPVILRDNVMFNQYGYGVHIYTNGVEFYPAMLDAIRSATRSVNMECYIFQPGRIADQFIDALSDRARRGLNVTIVVDAIGSFNLWGRPIRRLREEVTRLAAIAAATLLGVAAGAPAQAAELLVHNARIVTLDPQQPRATALCVAGGKFSAVGDEKLKASCTGEGIRAIDAGGRTLVPGLVDSHLHVIRAGRYWIPHWYAASHRIAYWDVFSRPATKPRYARGIPETWWYDRDKAAIIEQRG